MIQGTLENIIQKARKLTGSGNSLQITDEVIIDYINSFYLYDFPAEFRSLQLEDTFTINTIKGVDTYPFDYKHYSTLQSPAFVEKKLVPMFVSPWPFYSLFYSWQTRENIATGDGTTGPYTATANNTPIIRSYNNNPITDTQTNPTVPYATGTYPPSFREPNPSRVQNLLISANIAGGSLHVTDDGNGNLIGDGTGSIDYETGDVTNLTFSQAIPSGVEITMSYNPSTPSIPQAVLFLKNQITLRPIPDKSYIIEITAQRRPSQIMLGSVEGSIDMQGVPELLEWWETLAVGAAKKIYEDRQDMEGVQMMDKMLMERYNLNEVRTYAQISSSVMPSIFRGQLTGLGGGLNGFDSNIE